MLTVLRSVVRRLFDVCKWHVLTSLLIAVIILVVLESFGLLDGMQNTPTRGVFEADLRSPNLAIRAESIRRQMRLRTQRDDAALIENLQHENADIRLLAAQALGYEGPNAAQRVQALIPNLKDNHAGVRRETAGALGDNHLDPPLLAALNDESPRVRAGVLLALIYSNGEKEVGLPFKRLTGSVPVFTKLAKDDPDPEVRKTAERLLECVSTIQ
jgi:hypothetical protein